MAALIPVLPVTENEITTLSQDGAWCWFQDPRAVYVEGEHRRTYAGWITSEGALEVGWFDHDTRKIHRVVIRENWDADDHNTCSFLILPNHRLMLFYAQHCKTGLYCRVSKKPESIDSWEDEVIITNANNVTYSHPFYLANEKKIYVFWRHETWKPTFSTSTDGRSWTMPKMLLQEPGKEAHNVRPYVKFASDGKSKIDMVFTDGHPRKEPTNSVYYLRYEKGQFTRANGHIVGTVEDLPLAIHETDRVYDARKTSARAWVWDLGIDSDGLPVVLYTRHPTEKKHFYHYARWNGTEWRDSFLVNSGKWFCETPEGSVEKEPHYSGGMGLDHHNVSELFLSREINGEFEIEKWSTPDKGETWHSDAITSESSERNVRPLVPYGYAGDTDLVLWMQGHYRHYSNGFDTRIQLYHR